MSGGYFDLACDLWIIRDFMTKKAWNDMTEPQRTKALAEELDDELAGYGLPDDYTARKRAHIFATDECETWLAACYWNDIKPETLINLIPLMFVDTETAVATLSDNDICAFLLDGNQVVRFLRSGAEYERA